MREIKFRAWDKYSERMITSNQFAELLSVKEFARTPKPKVRMRPIKKSALIKRGEGLFGVDIYANYTVDKREIVEFESKKFNANPFIDEDLVLMQFTELKDKNGKDIYDGDLFTTFAAYWQAVFKDGCWFAKDIIGSYLDNNNRYKLLKDFVKNKAIIGNIYENKELLG